MGQARTVPGGEEPPDGNCATIHALAGAIRDQCENGYNLPLIINCANLILNLAHEDRGDLPPEAA